MTKQTRNFLVASAALLAVGLCVGLVAYYSGFAAGGAAQESGELSELSYVPADAVVVAYANVRDVMDSELRERLQRVEPDSTARQRFQEDTGIDIETDIDHVVASLMPGESVDAGFVLLRGRFDDARLEQLARAHGADIEEYGGRRVWQLGGDPDSESAVTFLEPGLALIGDLASVRRVIDHRESGPSVTSNAELMTLVREMDAGHNAWAVGQGEGLAGRAILPDEVSAQLPAIHRFAAGGRVNGGLTGTLRADARDEQSAQNLREVVRGFVALAKLQAGSRPAWQAVLESFQLGGAGSTVAISFTIPAEVIELLLPEDRRRPTDPIRVGTRIRDAILAQEAGSSGDRPGLDLSEPRDRPALTRHRSCTYTSPDGHVKTWLRVRL